VTCILCYTGDLQVSVGDVLCWPLVNGTWKLQLSALRALQPFVTRSVGLFYSVAIVNPWRSLTVLAVHMV